MTSNPLRAVWPPVAFAIAGLALWEIVVRALDLQPFVLPAPTEIWSAFTDRFGDVVDKSLLTGSNALVGLVVGVVLGIAMSFVTVRFRLLEEMVTPFAVALNAVPIVVVVPVLNNMLFGTSSQVPRRLMVALVVFFVVLVNVAKGLRQVSATQLELMRSYAATPRAILWKVRVPNALGHLFTALKIAAPLAVITAFVAEYFGGPQDGLANAVTNSLNGSKDVTWAYVIGASTLGLTFYLVFIVMERVVGGHGARRATG
ncbi:ABC transporter permease [Ilumatobacter sp.]|uniref:ABC transporter permease n=1 Tax=Ilumatobacter sp. TaxID=1967498 RepID=UPI003B51BC90